MKTVMLFSMFGLFVFACGDDDDSLGPPAGGDADTDADTDTDADGDTDGDGDGDTDGDADGDTDSDGDADTDGDGDTDTDGDGDGDTDADSDGDTDTDADADSDVDADSDGDSDADSDSDSDADGDSDTGSSCTPDAYGVCPDGRCVGAFCQSFLDVHNAVRQAVNDGTYLSQPQAVPPMEMMRWDPLIAQKSQAYADGMSHWDEGHSSQTYRTYASTWYSGYHGENMAIGSATAQAVVREMWCDGEAVGCTLSTCGGHYTQVVWRSSVALGCGWKENVPFDYGGTTYHGLLTVCEYGPGGNMGGQDPY